MLGGEQQMDGGSTVSADHPATTDERHPSDPPEASPLSTRLAFWAFCAYLAVAVVVLLVVIGRDQWFWVDEWGFLADRQLTLEDLFRPHNQHWSTLPILVYRGLFGIFGISTYLPYLAVVVVLHLTVVALLRVIMRRVGVGPWLATVAAGALVLFGPGSPSIVWAFQMGFNAALVLGLTQLLLADHDGPIDRRDWWGLAAGAGALMSAGVAVPLIVATAVVVLWRRGWLAAAFHAVPLGVVYAVWHLAVGTSASETDRTVGPFKAWERPGPADIARWAVNGGSAMFDGLGQHPLAVVVLVAMLAVGLPLAWFGLTRQELAIRAAIPVALLLALLGFLVTTAYTRVPILGATGARAGRYVYVYALFLLPALAVAGSALTRRWKPLVPFVFALFIVPIPWQLQEFEGTVVSDRAYFDHLQAEVVDLANAPEAGEVPPWVRPDQSLFGLGPAPIGWLIEQRENGSLPERPLGVPAADPEEMRLRLGVSEIDEDAPDAVRCEARTEPVVLELQVGDEIVIGSPVTVVAVDDSDAPLSTPLSFTSPNRILTVQIPDLRLRIGAVPNEPEFILCETTT